MVLVSVIRRTSDSVRAPIPVHLDERFLYVDADETPDEGPKNHAGIPSWHRKRVPS